MPYPVKHLIEGHPPPVTIGREEQVTKALSLMMKHDFSQLPVVDKDNHPLGMISYERILRGVNNFKAQLPELHVRDVMVKLEKSDLFDLEDDLFGLLKQLKLTNAVLIVDQQNSLAGIVTSFDSTEYFQNRAENLMRVEDIEAAVKDFILLAYARPDGSRDEELLAQAVLDVTPKWELENKQPKTFEGLSLNQYINILTSKKTWPFFEPIFNIPRASLGELLKDIRNTRNGLAHFRNEVTVEQTIQLRDCAEWLADRWEECQQTTAANSIVNHAIQIADDNVEKQPTLKASLEYLERVQDRLQSIAEESRPMESKYVTLADWLQSQPASVDMVSISFEEVEEIIGGPLPASAYDHRAWWANDSQGHPHSQLWLEAGWRTSYVNMTERRVNFVRIRERQQAYINFFSKLLAQLREKASFAVRETSPGGSSWAGCYAVNVNGSNVAQFGFGFIRNTGFRIELYIDTGNKESNKQTFDRIRNHETDIETKLGQITWERIDDKKASRIAIYHSGAITDNEDQLELLRNWAVDNMINFIRVIEPIALTAFTEVLKP
jgi:CBS domain-containing protein